MSSRDELSYFSYVILVLVGSGGAAPHDLLRMNQQGGRIYGTAAESRWYSEPKRLARLGYLDARKEPGRTRDRTWYTLTEKGRAAVAAWLAEPSGFVRIQNEPATRLAAADLAADDATVLRSLQAIRPEIEDQLRWLERAEEVASTLPHRERYLRLSHRLARRILHVIGDWLAEVERELGGSPVAHAGLQPRTAGTQHDVSEARTPEEDTIEPEDEPDAPDEEYEGPDPVDDRKGDRADEDQGT